jgi:hypothetical protein
MLASVKSRSLRARRERDKGFEQQARRVAWRIIKDWIAGQLALVEAGQAEVSEVFLPYVVSAQGETLFELFRDHSPVLLQAINRLALPASV